MHVASTTMRDDDATRTKRWALFSPPDDFDVADATVALSWVLSVRGARGGWPGGRGGGEKVSITLVTIGSLG